jgi:WD40 repeat protein
VAFSPDGKFILTGNWDKVAQKWDAVTGAPVGAPFLCEESITAVAFSPDGKAILTGGTSGRVRLWDTATGNFLGLPLQHRALVCALAFSPDGKTILTGSWDGTARLWAMPERKRAGLSLPLLLPWLAAASGNVVRHWEAESGQLPHHELNVRQCVAAVAFSPDGKLLLAGSGDPIRHTGEIRLWDADRRAPVQEAIPLPGPVLTAGFSPDGNRIAVGMGHPGQGPGQVWSTAKGVPLGPPLPVPPGAIPAVAFSRDGKRVLTGHIDNTARLWEVKDGRWGVKQSFRHQGWIFGVAFSPDGKTVLTGSVDRTARLWDVATGRQIGEALEHGSWVRGVAFSPDGKVVLTGSADGTARLWDVGTGTRLGPPLRHAAWVPAVAFSPDGRTIATGSADLLAGTGKVHLWRVPYSLGGKVEQVGLWVQVITGLEMTRSGAFHSLDARTWQERHQRLKDLGGPPDL